MVKKRTQKRIEAARHAAEYRNRKDRGVVLVKAEPKRQSLTEAIRVFAFSDHVKAFPELRRDLERVRSDCETWPDDKALLARIATAMLDEWSDAWLEEKLCQT